MFVTENNKPEMWKQMLKESFNVSDANTLDWVSEYASHHAIKESATLGVNGGVGLPGAAEAGNGVSPLYATPLNTIGMGNPYAPSQLSTTSTAAGDFFKQHAGSGDIPVSTLPMALNIALMTVGLELVPVIPAKGPWHLLTYMDFPYAGGKLGKKNEVADFDGKGEGRENKPLYFKVVLAPAAIAEIRKAFKDAKVVDGTEMTYTNGDYTVVGKFKGFGRMDGAVILETVSCKHKTDGNVSLVEAFRGSNTAAKLAWKADPETGVDDGDITTYFDKARVDFVQTSVDLIDGFANFATGKKEAMTRAQNETGTGNVIGLRLFSKWVQMGGYEVTATVTRQQLQDLPLYGVDAVSQVMEACQNEISQHINQRITNHLRQLGVTNAAKVYNTQGVNLNLWMGTAPASFDQAFPGVAEFKDIFGVDQRNLFGTIENAEVNTSAENTWTRQRRVMSRILAAANMIQVTSRRGRPDWILTNAQVATLLQDCSGYVVAPMTNTMAQNGTQNLYLGGTVAGLKVYVDPYMDWNDTRITVGRKGNGNEPGVIFMPYLLSDTVSITAEGTMAPKMLVNSRFGIVDAGFWPEAQYLTFCVGCEFGLI